MFYTRTVSPSSDATQWHLRRPNAIQAYGFLLVLEKQSLNIRRFSSNIADESGLAFSAMLGQPVGALLGAEAQDLIQEAVNQDKLEQSNPLELTLEVDGQQQVFEGVLKEHLSEGMVLELFPKMPDELSLSRFYSIFRRAMEQISSGASLEALYSLAAKELRRLSNFERVMLLKFGPDGHLQVLAEDCHPELDRFLQMHFPASDIPREARQIYYAHAQQLIVDTYGSWCPVVETANLDQAWDMATCTLRADAPEHLEHLRNMGVGALFSVALTVNDGLWGLLVCQHRTAKFVPYHVRSAADVFAQMLSMQIQSLEAKAEAEMEKHLADVASRLITAMATAENPAQAAAAEADLLELVHADGVAIRLEGEYHTRGPVPSREAVEAVAERILNREPSGKPNRKASHAVVLEDAPPKYPELFSNRQWASGMLFLPISRANGDYVVWFRREEVREVIWAGQPPKPGESPLPRSSFAPWKQEIFGHSRPWLEAEIIVAQEFTKALPELLLRRAQARLAHLVLHDPLTGLPSRAYLQRKIQPAIDQGQWKGSLVSVDFDRFKLVNDLLGQKAGDTVLQILAKRFQEVLVEEDSEDCMAVRMGGDEFLLVAKERSALEAEQLGWELSEQFRKPLDLGQTEYFISSSMGVAQNEPRTDFDHLIRRANAALSEAKRSGRNHVVVYDPALGSLEARVAAIEQAMRRAVRHGEFEVYFQPIVVPKGHIVGAEALLRWNSPELGWVSPSEFIPIAEQNGLIGPLGRWVLDQSLWHFHQWRQHPQIRNLSLSVNLSVKQLIEPDLLPAIEKILGKYKVGPERIRLEVTETSLMTDPEQSRNLLEQMRNKGIRISIDDFGTGFSSLSYVRALPVHQLKIDRSFLYEASPNTRNQAVISTIVHLAHELGLEAVAEGVETEANRQMLTELGCDLLQGFLFSRPVPPDQFFQLFLHRLNSGDAPNE